MLVEGADFIDVGGYSSTQEMRMISPTKLKNLTGLFLLLKFC
jgi:hypothetical protein